MTLQDMICVIELIDTNNDFQDIMKSLMGNSMNSDTIAARFDKVYRLVRNNIYEGFDLKNDSVYDKVMNIVNNSSLLAEQRAKYVLYGEL